jgi:hypothetical protein
VAVEVVLHLVLDLAELAVQVEAVLEEMEPMEYLPLDLLILVAEAVDHQLLQA